MKKWILLVSIIIIVFLIYQFNKDTKIDFLNISDTEIPYTETILDYYKKQNQLKIYNNSFSKPDYRITDLYLDIENNKTITVKNKNQSINNSLIKSEIITISIGNTDLYYKMNFYDVNEMYNYIDELCKDYDKLLEKIRLVTKEKIIIYGYTTSDLKNKQLINYYNERLKMLCEKYNINFLPIDKFTNKNLINWLNKWQLHK